MFNFLTTFSFVFHLLIGLNILRSSYFKRDLAKIGKKFREQVSLSET